LLNRDHVEKVLDPFWIFLYDPIWIMELKTRRDMLVRPSNFPKEITMPLSQIVHNKGDRRFFVGGSDARIIMGSDERALVRLWREKRGEAESEDLSGNLIVQLGAATEELNRTWYERNTGRRVRDVQRQVRHSAISWMMATLDGIVEGTEAVFESKFMLPWSFSEEAAAEKYMPQLQHNMWVTHLRTSVLSIITGGGKWVEIAIPMDPLYLSLLVSAEKKFWRCVQSGEIPHLVLLSRRVRASMPSASSI
jgi:predicted phage-related endonuclease